MVRYFNASEFTQWKIDTQYCMISTIRHSGQGKTMETIEKSMIAR